MKGRILGCDSSGGAISNDAGERFKFAITEWKGPGWPQPRDEVDFVVSDGAATELYPVVEASTPGDRQTRFTPPAHETATADAFPSNPHPTAALRVRKIGPFRAFWLAWRNGFNFGGRSCRAEYWWFVMLGLLLSLLVLGALITDMMQAMIDCAKSTGTDDASTMQCFHQAERGAFGGSSGAATKLLFLIVLPGIALAVRRLHDTGRSGWRYLLVFTGIGIIPLLFWFLQKGEAGPNKYGADPRVAV